MFDFFAQYADPIFAAAEIGLTACLVPTIINQFRTRDCSIPLPTSIITAGMLTAISLVLFSTGLYLATATCFTAVALWGLIAAQRVMYNKDSDETLYNIPYTYVEGPCNCPHYARSGWCFHFD